MRRGRDAIGDPELLGCPRPIRKCPDSPNPDCHVVLLEERGGDRRLAIWIGHEQAFWLAWRLEEAEAFRPGPYDMTVNAIQMTRVFSSSPISAMASRTRPTLWSAFSW
jgi:Domain of unknown function (DUF151)